MKERVLYYLKLNLFWLLIFFICRMVFVAFVLQPITSAELLLASFYGLKLDLSISSYLLIPPFLLLLLEPVLFRLNIKQIIRTYTLLLLPLIFLITLIDANLYNYWAFKLDNTIFQFIHSPSQILASMTVWDFIIPIPIVVVLFFVAKKLYALLFGDKNFKSRSSQASFLFYLFVASTLFIPIRGGFSISPLRLGIPINVGAVYFSSSNQFANHTAVNTVWNFMNSSTRGHDKGVSINYMDTTSANVITQQMLQTSVETKNVLNTKTPNVLLIIWESATANIIEPLGGIKEVTPNFNELCKEGILFNHFYANGDRSDKGMVALLSAYPAQPTTSIIKESHKMEELPFLMTDFKNEGYTTSFYYGGEIDFANFRSYFYHGGTEVVKSKLDYDAKYYNSKWGVNDHVMFNSVYEDLNKVKEPFFTSFFTLSSHEPFDVPHTSKFKGSKRDDMFCNAANYTDKCLGDFIRKAKQTDWWKNTLVVIVADHGLIMKGIQHHSPSKYHIPMLWLGGALAVKDTVITNYGSQTDLANTLIAQTISKGEKQYPFSKNLLAKENQSFAFYSFNNGFGIMKDSSYAIYNNEINTLIESTTPLDSITLTQGKAYMQRIVSDYDNK